MTKVYDNATDIITFSRLQSQNPTSGSSYLGSDGLLKFAAEDEPRIEYAADGSLKGLLIEEQRTNLVTYSEDLTAWHTFSGETSVTLSSDTIYGVSAYEVTGSTGGFGLGRLSPNGGTSINLTSDGVLTFWAKKITAGTTLQYLWNGSVIIFDSQVPNDGQWHKVEITLAAANSALQLLRGFTSGTVALAMPQLEAGSFATSYIPTSGSQSTRSPDIASIPVSAFGYNQEAGTVVVDFATLATFGSRTNDGVFSLRDNSTDVDDFLRMYIQQNDNLSIQVRSNNSTVFATTIQTDLPEQSETKVAFGFTSGSYAASVDGGAAQSLSTSTTYPVAGEITELAIGEINGNAYLNGHIKSLSYYPRRLTDAQLQELTS